MDAETKADYEAGRITRQVAIAAPRRTTWEALTDPAAIEAWWGHPAVFPDGMREGSNGTFEWTGHGVMPMRIQRFDEPEHFHLLWGGVGDDEPGEDASLVEFHLAEDGPDRTVVTVVESGFLHLGTAERRSAMEENVKGWTQVLDGLVEYVESRS